MRYLNIKRIFFSSLFLINSLSANEKLFDEDIEKLLSITTESKVDVGSRDDERNYLSSNTPIDVVTNQQIKDCGLTSLIDVLRYYVAGFNAPETSIADGSDHVRAYTLMGMNPDQILVLINGKRVHTSALLHVNNTIGRGSSHVDLDTISLVSIDRIEILRDGAAAQYGSDAIAGVINIILKGSGYSNILNVQSGIRKAGDGEQLEANLFMSIPLKYDGFVNFTFDAKKQNQTQRAGLDHRVEIPRVTTHVGIPDYKNYIASVYTEILQENGTNIYSQLSVEHKDSEASAFFRPSNEISKSLYSDGFLPIIEAKIMDYIGVIGIKGELDDSITWDLSNSYGLNNFHYFVNNSMNYSLDASSPEKFDNGSLSFTQNTTTLEFKKDDDRFKIAGGLEFKYENYKIKKGDYESYIGTGSEGFAGYGPENEVDVDRDNYAIYIDGIYHLSEKIKLESALRYENYSDAQESTTSKVAISYKLTSKIMLRGSGSTGFRVPSLAQSFYSQTSSFIDSNNELTTQGTFRVDHEVSKSLGAKKLKSEKSKHLTIGTVFRPNKKTSLTVDYSYIVVRDKIVLTPDLSPRTQEQKEIFAKYNLSAARFFANAARMTTKGINIKLNHQYIASRNSTFDFGVWFSYSKNSVKKTDDISLSNSNNSTEIMIESGQPKDSLKLLTKYKYKKLETTLNIDRYGSYVQLMNDEIYKFNAAWITDLNIAYKLTKNIKTSFGGINIFDAMPNKWDNLDGDLYGTNGIKQYSRYSPFGYSGAYYYIKLSMKF